MSLRNREAADAGNVDGQNKAARTGKNASENKWPTSRSRQEKSALKANSSPAKPRPVRHGMSGSPECHAWAALVQRCTNPKNHGFVYYGARGITVAPEWLGPGAFERFFANVGQRPSPKHSLDRIDNSKDYQPGNVRWAAARQQVRNRRKSLGDLAIGAIRANYATGRCTQRTLARRFGVTQKSISRVVRGKVYAEIWPELPTGRRRKVRNDAGIPRTPPAKAREQLEARP